MKLTGSLRLDSAPERADHDATPQTMASAVFNTLVTPTSTVATYLTVLARGDAAKRLALLTPGDTINVLSGYWFSMPPDSGIGRLNEQIYAVVFDFEPGVPSSKTTPSRASRSTPRASPRRTSSSLDHITF